MKNQTAKMKKNTKTVVFLGGFIISQYSKTISPFPTLGVLEKMFKIA